MKDKLTEYEGLVGSPGRTKKMKASSKTGELVLKAARAQTKARELSGAEITSFGGL